jgi:hypothetical protein
MLATKTSATQKAAANPARSIKERVSFMWPLWRIISIMRRLLILAMLALALGAQTRVNTVAEITGSNAAVQINTTGSAVWVTIMANATNATTNCSTSSMSACPRVGDSSVSATRGIPLLPGTSGFYPVPLPNSGYSLAQLYVYIPNGDKINVLWAN